MKRDYIHYIDPAGLAEAQTDQRTCAGIMATPVSRGGAGIKNIFPGPIDWESRRKAVEHFLMTVTKEGPAFQLHAKHAPKLSKGMAGAYRYPDKYLVLEPGKPKPIKDEYSHVADALQYLCGGALALLRKPAGGKPIPTPQYSFADDGSTRKREQYGT